MSASPAVRSLRAAVFAAVCVLLAVAGHRLGAGDTPPVWVAGAGFLGVFVTGWLLGGRERSLAGIGAVMLATQGALHVAFDVARPHLALVPSPRAMSMADEAMDGHVMGSLDSVSALLAAAVEHAHEMCTPVTAAHLLAALAASWWLRRGEAALWSVLRQAAASVPAFAVVWRRAAPLPLPAPGGRPRRTATDIVPPRQLLLRHALRRRGPPARIPYSI